MNMAGIELATKGSLQYTVWMLYQSAIEIYGNWKKNNTQNFAQHVEYRKILEQKGYLNKTFSVSSSIHEKSVLKFLALLLNHSLHDIKSTILSWNAL